MIFKWYSEQSSRLPIKVRKCGTWKCRFWSYITKHFCISDIKSRMAFHDQQFLYTLAFQLRHNFSLRHYTFSKYPKAGPSFSRSAWFCWPWNSAQHLPRPAFSWHPPPSISPLPSQSASFMPRCLPPICIAQPNVLRLPIATKLPWHEVLPKISYLLSPTVRVVICLHFGKDLFGIGCRSLASLA